MENFSLYDKLGAFVSKFHKKNVFYSLGVLALLILLYLFFFSAPWSFASGTVVRIDPGMSLREISSLLSKDHVIRSRVVFESLAIALGAESHTQSGDYIFESRLPIWEVVWRIKKGEHRVAPVSITIPEGFDVKQIADACALKLTKFNEGLFLTQAEPLEGYLFPDTYFFLTDADEADVIKSMNDNFTKKITPLLPDIAASYHSEKEIITMASIIEREAKGDADREIIAGILWKRISLGMPLQVDAAPETYKTKGLPKMPIANPGIKAIYASIHPENSPYLYYLHDKAGNVHYAKTFAEHTANKLKYLK